MNHYLKILKEIEGWNIQQGGKSLDELNALISKYGIKAPYLILDSDYWFYRVLLYKSNKNIELLRYIYHAIRQIFKISILKTADLYFNQWKPFIEANPNINAIEYLYMKLKIFKQEQGQTIEHKPQVKNQQLSLFD